MSPIFEVDNIKNYKQLCETSFKNGKLSAQLVSCITPATRNDIWTSKSGPNM